MGKTYKQVFNRLAGVTQPAPRTGSGAGSQGTNNLRAWQKRTPQAEQRKYLDQAHKRLRDGLMVFMDKDAVDGFEKLLGARPTNKIMRRLLADVGAGKLTLGAGTNAPKPSAPACQPEPHDITGVIETSEIPLTLRQASQALHVKPVALYYRCLRNRIAYQKHGSRYYIPVQEIARLKVVGIY